MAIFGEGDRAVEVRDPGEMFRLLHGGQDFAPGQRLWVERPDGEQGQVDSESARELVMRGGYRLLGESEAQSGTHPSERGPAAFAGSLRSGRMGLVEGALGAFGADQATQERARSVMEGFPDLTPGGMAARAGAAVDEGDGLGLLEAVSPAAAIVDTASNVWDAASATDEEMLAQRRQRHEVEQANPFATGAGRMVEGIEQSVAGGASIAGRVGGSAAAQRAAAVLPGIVARGAGFVGTAAAEGAVEGLIAAGQAVDLEDEELTVEMLASNIGTGAVIGGAVAVPAWGASEAIAAIGSRVLPRAMDSFRRHVLQDHYRPRHRNAMDASRRFEGGMDEVLDHAIEKRLMGDEPAQSFDLAENHRQVVGRQIEDFFSTSDGEAAGARLVDGDQALVAFRAQIEELDVASQENLRRALVRRMAPVDERFAQASPAEVMRRRTAFSEYKAAAQGQEAARVAGAQARGMRNVERAGARMDAAVGAETRVARGVGDRNAAAQAAYSDAVDDFRAAVSNPSSTEKQTLAASRRVERAQAKLDAIAAKVDEGPPGGRRAAAEGNLEGALEDYASIPPSRVIDEAIFGEGPLMRPLTLREMWDIRKAFDADIYRGDAPLSGHASPMKVSLRNIRRAMQDTINDTIGEMGPDTLRAYRALNEDYSKTMLLRSWSEFEAASRQAKGGMGEQLRTGGQMLNGLIYGAGAFGGVGAAAKVLAGAAAIGGLKKILYSPTVVRRLGGWSQTMKAVAWQQKAAVRISKFFKNTARAHREIALKPTKAVLDHLRSGPDDYDAALAEMDVDPREEQTRYGDMWADNPHLAMRATAVSQRKRDALRARLPTPNVPPGAYQHLVTAASSISDHERASFMRYRAVARNPNVALDFIESGMATPEVGAALRDIYPVYHQRMQEAVAEQIAAAEEPAPYPMLVQLGYIFPEMALDPTLEGRFISAMQRPFREQAGGEAGGQMTADVQSQGREAPRVAEGMLTPNQMMQKE